MNDTIFQTTMRGLETGLQVQHIATLDDELRTCDIDDERDVATLFADSQFQDFDQIPVRKERSIIGVVTRECEGSITKGHQPLTEAMLIAAQEPLTQFISLMASRPLYRLVIRSGRISGIVTRSDLLKLPVRLFAFTLVTHLELLMTDIIRAKYPDYQDDPQWLQYLNEARQENINKKHQSLKQENYELPLLESTDFCDKRDIVSRICPVPSRRKFMNDLGKIERDLRNKVAHAANYIRNDQEMERFIRLIILTQEWIRKLELGQNQ
jgi:CBS domain-containing protein